MTGIMEANSGTVELAIHTCPECEATWRPSKGTAQLVCPRCAYHQRKDRESK